MMRVFTLVFGLMVFRECSSKALPDEVSVVSVYTTLPTTPHHQLDVYHQIANNIAERITSPIYRFLGFGGNATVTSNHSTTTHAPWKNIEKFDDSDEEKKPIDNDISDTRDVEELSTEALKKVDRKPEKITLNTNYLPVVKDRNDNVNEISDDEKTFGFDDDEGIEDDNDIKPRDGPLVYILEILGSIFQLLYGGIVALFSPSQS